MLGGRFACSAPAQGSERPITQFVPTLHWGLLLLDVQPAANSLRTATGIRMATAIFPFARSI